MRPHLIVDCVPEDGRVAAGLRACLGAHQSRTVRAPLEPLPDDPRAYASVIVSGSSASACDSHAWLCDLVAWLQQAARADVPVLGVCFGHQLLARAMCGPQAVRRAERSELGWVEIERRTLGEPADGLLAGLPPRFPCFVSHFDEVVPQTPGLELLARTPRCPVHAYRVRGRRMWGVQFHPELPPEVCAELVRAKVALHPGLGEDPRPVLARAIDVRPLGRALLASFVRLTARAAPERRAG